VATMAVFEACTPASSFNWNIPIPVELTGAEKFMSRSKFSKIATIRSLHVLKTVYGNFEHSLLF